MILQSIDQSNHIILWKSPQNVGIEINFLIKISMYLKISCRGKLPVLIVLSSVMTRKFPSSFFVHFEQEISHLLSLNQYNSIHSEMSLVHLFPVASFLLCASAFVGASLATILDGRKDGIPYISEGGSFVPQSCFFGQALNLAAISIGITIYIRYHQIQMITCWNPKNDINKLINRLNGIGLWMGLGSCLGLSIVGNFQTTNASTIHHCGAFLTFFGGNVYFWIQSQISYNVYPHVGSTRMAHFRYALATCSTIFCFTTIIASCKFIELVSDQDENCKYQSISIISEWIAAMTFCFYVFSFTWDFRKIVWNCSKITPASCVIDI